MLAIPNARVILVDFSCPQNTGNWAEANYPDVCVVRVPNKKYFHISEARNAGANAGTGEWLFFLDADMHIDPNKFESDVRPLLTDSELIRFKLADMSDVCGQCLCQRSLFNQLAGYDEVFQGWGREDRDFYDRASMLEAKTQMVANTAISSIKHDDNMRVENQEIQSREANQLIGNLYGRAKLDLMKIIGTPVPEEWRRKIHADARKAVLNSALSNNEVDLFVTYRKKKLNGMEISSVLHQHADLHWGRWKPSMGTKPISQSIRQALSALDQHTTSKYARSNEEPTFVLSVGYGTDANYFLNCIDPDVHIWRGSYDRIGVLDNLAQTIRGVTNSWPPKSNDKPTHTPDVSSLCQATENYINTLFRRSKTFSETDAWGFSTHNSHSDHAFLLRWIYPKAKIVILMRNPFDAFKTYLQSGELQYATWPSNPLNSAETFAAQWNSLTYSLFLAADELKAKIVRYEDIVRTDYDWSSIETYLEREIQRISPDAITINQQTEKEYMSKRDQLQAIVARVAELVGY